MRNKVEIIKAKKEGYETVLKYEAWRIGLIKPAERFSNITYLERHLLTDEAFILLEGHATLIHMDDAETVETYEMQSGVIYNIPQANWHAVKLDADALVMVVENADTARENSEYRDFEL